MLPYGDGVYILLMMYLTMIGFIAAYALLDGLIYLVRSHFKIKPHSAGYEEGEKGK